MPELVWSAIGQRFFETGVDRGVFYPTSGAGVPWNGLLSVSESANGGSPTPFYMDGYKYLNLASSEEFQAKLDALSAPEEFFDSDGIYNIRNGLFVTQQVRQQFGLCYRTQIGNDTEGIEHGYKIHLVYNCLASPTARNNRTIGDASEPMILSWDITTTPPNIAGYRPTAHFIIDSRKTPRALMIMMEKILYGSASSESRQPSVAELMDLFNRPYEEYDIFQNTLTGISPIGQVPSTEGDLRASLIDGVYLIPDSTMLSETETEGLFLLES